MNSNKTVITYVAINLDTKRFQVGSTLNFERRYKEHCPSDINPKFTRSLRSNPHRFFWLLSTDDELKSRGEEQFYLDFYCGTRWCYNINPNALSENQGAKLGDAHRGKKYGKRDPSVGKKISETKRGKELSEDHKKALAKAEANIPLQTCEVCGEEIGGGKGNLRQHIRKHQGEANG